jgi:hypothetical protein
MSIQNTLAIRLRAFWGTAEVQVLLGNIVLHVLIQILGLALMPLAEFSELSDYDGAAYYRISYTLWPDQPIYLLHWHKRILMPLLANLVFPWERHISFLVIGIVAVSLSAVYFYKIASKYSQHPLILTVLYSMLPWLFYSAHVGLAEPLLMLFLLAGYYYYTENRPVGYTICFALALLTKEIAVIPLLALTILIWKRYGWRRVLSFLIAVLPFGLFCFVYGLHWDDCMWCAKNSPENSFTWQSGFWWIWVSLKAGSGISNNPVATLIYDLINAGLSSGTLAVIALGIYRLRRVDIDLMLYNLLIYLPLLFLGYNLYSHNTNMGRQYLISSMVIIGFGGILSGLESPKNQRLKKAAVATLLAGEFALGIFWILVHTGYFLDHKLF